MVYNKQNDLLHEYAYYGKEFLKLEEVVCQMFNKMNDSSQWGAQQGVDFHGFKILTGNPKGNHTWFAKFIANKTQVDKIVSDYDDKVLKIDKDLRKIVLSSLRMNLYLHDVIVESGDADEPEGKVDLIYLDDDGEVSEEPTSRPHIKRMISWIVDPVELLASCFGEILNVINSQVVFGQDEYNNYGELLRGAKGKLLETITEKVFNKMNSEHSIILKKARETPWEVEFVRPIYFHGTEITI